MSWTYQYFVNENFPPTERNMAYSIQPSALSPFSPGSISLGRKPETPKPAAEQSKERADLTFDSNGKKFNLEIVVINDQVFIFGKDKKNQTVILDTGVKVQNSSADQLKAIATKFLSPPNPNSMVTAFFNQVAPAKPAELKNSIKVEQNLLTNTTGVVATIALDSRNTLVGTANATQVSAELKSKFAIGTSTNLSAALGYNATNQKLYGSLGLEVALADNWSINGKVGQAADGSNVAAVSTEFRF
jgi:hypothetical protein